jgi:sialate O-acetylesterase
MNKLKVLISVFLIIQSTNLIGQIKLPKLISDGVILQRDEKVKVWGWAAPNEKIKLVFKTKTYNTEADSNGKWHIMLPAQKAGGPFEMVLKASNKITIQDILFGDIWVCSGQSNMELPMERLKEKYGDVIKNATNSNIRQFLVPDTYNFKEPQKDFKDGSWVAATPNTVLEFSGVAYFFAKDIYEKHQIPVGIINSALGGSPIESWLSDEALKAFPKSYEEVQKYKNDTFIEHIENSDKKRSDDWYALLNSKDKGLYNHWDLPAGIDFSDWDNMEIPGYLADSALGNVNGAVWFSKDIMVPKVMLGKPAKLFLGRIVDQDSVYINGEFVGTTGYQYPPRRYEVKPTILKEGKNTISIRIINTIGRGGFVLDKPYYLAVDNDTIDLKGTWKYKLGTTMQPLQGPTFIRWKPEGLYNAMIAPLTNLKIKGVLWYQGESNTDNPEQYAKTLPALINDWRNKWHQGKFPFLFVQLTNFMETTPEPTESNWAQLRQSQLESLKVPNTGMAVTIDLGEWNDIHPLNKEDVGKRLALLARKMAYGEKTIQASSPLPCKATFNEHKVIISFENKGSDLIIKGGDDLKGFSISDDGVNFVWAKAIIKNNKVEVWNETTKNPTVVRYAWANNPEHVNLYSKAGLPSTPFEIKKTTK